MAKIKFHLDENISLAIANGLRRRAIDISTTPEQGMIGQSDEQQLEFGLSQDRVIFTQDTDFLRLHRAGYPHAGIVYCPQKRGASQCKQKYLAISNRGYTNKACLRRLN